MENAPKVDAVIMCMSANSMSMVRVQCPTAAVIAQYFMAERGVLLMLAKPIDAKAENIMSSNMTSNVFIGYWKNVILIKAIPQHNPADRHITSNAACTKRLYAET